MSSVEAPTRAPTRRRFLVFLPLVGFVLLAGLLLVRLSAGDPSRLPSALVGHPIPNFELAALPGLTAPGLRSSNLKNGGVTLINVFASWCAECHEEHDALNRLAADPEMARKGVRLDGIAYKDKAEDTRRFLEVKGNPYQAIGNDASGRTGIDLGVYGVPETFVVRGDGTIVYKLVGAVTPQTLGGLMAAIDKAVQ